MRRAPARRGTALLELVVLLVLACRAPQALAHPADVPFAADPGEVEQESRKEEDEVERRPWLALAEATFANLVIWSVDRFVRQQDWARVGPSTWSRNLAAGLVWDTDTLNSNQLAHPFHGSIYFNAARDNGFGYWGSVPFVLFGALQWEVVFENAPPSLNDLVNTTMGGPVFGETLYRLSSLVLDNEASGGARLRRELLAGLLNPARGLNRVVTGAAWKLDSNPPEWRPLFFGAQGRAGALDAGPGGGLDRFFLELKLAYGDPLRSEIEAPFDAFTGSLQFTSGERRVVSHAELRGVLAARTLSQAEGERVVLAAVQQLRYVDTLAYQIGGQFFAASLLYRRAGVGQSELRAGLELRGLVLTGISSEYAGVADRTYDYGPGLGLAAAVSFGPWPWSYLKLEASSSWVHTVNGAEANHLALELGLEAWVPVYRSVGVGAAFGLFRRESFFRDFAPVVSTVPMARLFVSLQ